MEWNQVNQPLLQFSKYCCLETETTFFLLKTMCVYVCALNTSYCTLFAKLNYRLILHREFLESLQGNMDRGYQTLHFLNFRVVQNGM